MDSTLYMALVAQRAAARTHQEMLDCMHVAERCEADGDETAELWREWARSLQRTTASQACQARRLLGI